MKAMQLAAPGGFEHLKLVDLPAPAAPAAGEIQVRIHASSLNYHDLAVVAGRAPTADGRIPMADGAGEVIAVGTDVSEFKVGDSVVSTPTLIMDRCKSDTMEHYAKALKHLEGREAEFDLIFPGHYVHPIPKTYLKELIVCAEKIVENPLYGTPEKNHMSDQIAYRAFYKKASILYTMDRVTGEKAPQE